MKGCLKYSSCTPMPSPGLPPAPPCTPTHSSDACQSRRKCVAFSMSALEEIYVADEWDRTPTEPARHLSYSDLLELKEIQRSLPLADQPADPFTHKPGSQYLSHVPIKLLPLLPESSSCTTPSICASSNTPSPVSEAPSTQLPTKQHFVVRPGRLFPHGISSRSASPSPANSRSSSPNRSTKPPFAKPPPCILPLTDHTTAPKPASSPSSPLGRVLPPQMSHLSHLMPKNKVVPTPKRSFAFLPLLETPPSTASNTPLATPLHSELNSAVTSRANSTLSSPMPSLPNSPTIALKALEESAPKHDDATTGRHLSDSDDGLDGVSRVYDPPTPSLTIASLDSSPPTSRASSMSPHDGYFPHHPAPSDAFDYGVRNHSPVEPLPAPRPSRLSALPSPSLVPPSPLKLGLSPNMQRASPFSFSNNAEPRSPTLLDSVHPHGRDDMERGRKMERKVKEKKKRQVIVINDEEIVIGSDSEDDDLAESESETSSMSSGAPPNLGIGGFVGVGMRNSRFAKSMGERMSTSSSTVWAFEDEDTMTSASISRSPSQQDGFVGVSTILGIQSTSTTTMTTTTTMTSSSTRSSPTVSMSVVNSMSTATLSTPKVSSSNVNPNLLSPVPTPTPTPPPESRMPSGLALALARSDGLRSRSLTPTLHEAEWTAPSSPYSGARGSVGTSGQQLTPPPSEPGSPSKYSENACSHSSPTRSRGCCSPTSFRSSASSKVSISPRVSCSPRSSGIKASTSLKVSTSPKCVGNGSTVARKRASMSPRSSPVLA
ncbi:hypothetical protein BDN71DRAFT_174702 [Pleurotus eryngii]|uniref:Uncharacterized protein n=1 Tax=Pleurotus eryngii TaxID=5323 RepID=A0A9P6DC57_PLEER|nr:hypothetical protein BDN71DRAFT_174702 [Pleurotus eryngii]